MKKLNKDALCDGHAEHYVFEITYLFTRRDVPRRLKEDSRINDTILNNTTYHTHCNYQL